jgi:hypothetical protein
MAEKARIEALIGAPLEETNLAGLDGRLRSLCGVLVSTPQFMLGGLVPRDTRDVPKVSPIEGLYETTCNNVVASVVVSGAPYQITCGQDAVTAKRP